MARQLAAGAITDADITSYLSANDDFQLELEVLHFCWQADFQVTHGGTYEDPSTNKARQFDLRVALRKDLRGLRLAIECKSLKPNFPMVISRIPRTSNERQHDVVAVWKPRDGRGQGRIRAATFRTRPIASMYKVGEMVGKSVTQIGKHPTTGAWIDGDSEVYEKWAQAFASCRDLIIEAGTAYEEYRTERFWTFVAPVLVVRDATLWVVDYNINGSIQNGPRPVDEAQIYVAKEYTVTIKHDLVLSELTDTLPYMLSHLHVYTLSGFKKAFTALKNYGDWDDLIPLSHHEVDGELR